ncbi:hypothetical protein ACWKWU_20920 [Chitinophaga lutea]
MEVAESYLSALGAYVVAIDSEFRRRVCLDCGWSTATFYRRIKPGQVLTAAEKLAIQNIVKQITKDLNTLANKSS